MTSLQKIYVGNLPFSTRENELEELFKRYGNVNSVKIPVNPETGKSRGFGFVEMTLGEASQAIENLDGLEFNGRGLRVNEARSLKNIRRKSRKYQ